MILQNKLIVTFRIIMNVYLKYCENIKCTSSKVPYLEPNKIYETTK